jgi:fructose-1,6-bisphosphatase I
MERVARISAELALRIARGGLDEALQADTSAANAAGDVQTTLDVIADNSFREALAGSDVRFFASEEQDQAVELNPRGTLALAMDPLDGTSNIAVNVSIGSIFAIFPAAETAEGSFFRPGRHILAGGYIIYGPQCVQMVSFGAGVQCYLLEPASRRFVLLDRQVTIPRKSTEFAINASNYRHWPRPIRAWVDDCVAGADGPRADNFNMRWIASLVAECHRILTRGGVFLYPADARKGYERGRLRYLYECAPIAFLIEQAGGAATDGIDPILDRVPRSLHERTPLVFGSADTVAQISAYHDLPEAETAALFGRRGLFRS